MIITIDGGDGVGKTTLAKRLAQKYNFKYIDKPIHFFLGVTNKENGMHEIANNIQERAYAEQNTNDFKAWFTMMSLIYLRDNVNKNDNIIIDRGMLSSYIFNGDNKSMCIYELLCERGLGFDLCILLDATAETRIARIKRRNPNDSDLRSKKIKSLNADTACEFADKIKLNYIFVKTDSVDKKGHIEEKSIDEVFNFVDETLNQMETFKSAIKK